MTDPIKDLFDRHSTHVRFWTETKNMLDFDQFRAALTEFAPKRPIIDIKRIELKQAFEHRASYDKAGKGRTEKLDADSALMSFTDFRCVIADIFWMIPERPSDEEIEQMAESLGSESTAPDKETPDWMIADIKRGLRAMRDRIFGQDKTDGE